MHLKINKISKKRKPSGLEFQKIKIKKQSSKLVKISKWH